MGTLNYFKDGVWVSSDDPAGTIPQDVADQINDLVERPTVTYGSAPVSPKAGDVWIDSEGNKTKVFNGTVWVIAQDTDISGLAGSKNRVFLSPSTPIGTTGYTPVNGDLWIDSDDDNKIYIYNNTKFDVAPLGSAALADSLQTTINTASSQAASATSAIGDILSDDKVTPDEKYRLAKEWAVIDAERAGMASQATTYGIDQTDFNTATTSLDTLLNNATNGILLNMSSTSTISGQSVRVAFTDYYAQRTALLNAIYAKVKSIADSKTRAYYSDTMPTGLSFVNGDIWFDTNDDNRIYIYEDGFVPVEFGVNALARGTITKNTFGSDTTISNIIGVPTTTYSDLYNGFVTVAGAANSIRLNNVITENGSWTFSCMARRTGGAGNITVDICDGGTLTFTMGTDWSSVVLTHDVANFGASYHFVDIAFSAAGTFEFKQVQVEKGTRSTEWVPSATDLTNRIYQVKLSADSKNNIYYADVAPSSEIDNPYRTGDTWYHMVDVGGVKGIDGIWHFDATKGTGLKWSKEVLQNGVFGQLDAAKITTGFLSASRIDAGTITADKVVLSSGANLLQDPGFSKAELWDTTTCTIAPTAGMAGGPAAQLVTHAATPKYVHGLVERLNVARVIEGSNYRAGIWVKASNTVLASKIKLYGSWMDSKTAIKGTWNIVYGSALAANTWTHLSGLTGPVPSGASFSSFGLEVAATTAGVTLTVSEPFLQQAAGAELIVDGAITTDKLSANAVTAAKIKANTITVNELASDVGTGLILTSNTAITAKVSKDEVINQINLSPEAITISGNKINIDGALEISNWASGEDSTKIDGGSIYANSITANKLASDVGTGLDISSNDSITSRVTSTDMDAAINKLVMSITDYYALSTNPTTPPASGWGTTVPTWTDGSYIWHRQTILYKDTTSTETSPVNITGAMGKTGAAAINVFLSSESCSVPADNSGNVTSYVGTGTTIQLFEGATELTYDGIGTNNGFWKVTASGSNITPSSPTDSGQHATYGDHSAMALGSDTALITYTISGKRTDGTDFSILRSQNFTKSKAGSDGAAGKVANIIASSQIFKSTDGGIVFSPDSIVLTPSLQNVTYSKWQYSTNGGTTWVDAESGSNGITIGTVNAVDNCLTLVKTSALYTSAITSVVFKLVTNDTAVSDTVTISKLYDVADLKIGASNLVKNTSYLLTDATDGAVLGLGGVKVVGADPKTHTVRVSEALPAPPTGARSLYINNTSPSVENTSGVMQLIYGKVIANTNLILSFYTKASTAGSAWVKICNDNFSIVSAKKTFNLTTDWQLTSIDMGTIPTAAENMRLMFGFGAAIPALGDNGHLINSIMLEYGTKPTNWFPAPQDFIDSIAAQTIISDTIKSEVLQTRALADTTARLLAEFDTEVSNTYSSVEQTSEAININLTTFYANTLSKTMTDIENTFKFTADGLKIAKSTSPYKVSIDNDSLDFLHIDPVSRVESEKATISGDGMKIPDAYISNSLHVGYHQVVKFDTGDAGNTVFRWIGEQ